MDVDKLYIVGVASGIAAGSQGCAAGPEVFKASVYPVLVAQDDLPSMQWVEIFFPAQKSSIIESLVALEVQLAECVRALTSMGKRFLVVGGDHSCAIGTWSGAAVALHSQGALGLLWIDAHLDAHTPETSETGNLHGMPVATLLGYGAPSLVQVLDSAAKIDPRYLCYVGVRSFEAAEQALIERLGVRVYYMAEIKQRGLQVVLREALERVSQAAAGFGITLDIDALEPLDAPGTGLPVADGITGQKLCESLVMFQSHPKLVGVEIAEFDPSHDSQGKTGKLIGELVSCLFKHSGQPF